MAQEADMSWSDFAMKLERELAEAIAKRDEWYLRWETEVAHQLGLERGGQFQDLGDKP
jgi:hypothetical protein